MEKSKELKKHLLWLIIIRAIILFSGLNLADHLGLLPSWLDRFSFLSLFNFVTAALGLTYFLLWWTGRFLFVQLCCQVGIDLLLTTILVASTRGIDSPFVSFYLLIITFCSLALGRNGGLLGAALSTILYASLITSSHLGILTFFHLENVSGLATFRISVHALGFFCVAWLGAHLSQRLREMQQELEEKTDSFKRLQRLNEHIVSSIRSGLITTDLSGRIATFNNAAEEITGRESIEALDQHVQQILGSSLWAKIGGVNLLAQARALRHEDWIALPGGEKRYLGFSVSPLVDQGQQLLGYIVAFQNMTEIKRLEEEIRLKERLAAIGRMAAAIAHEIRNPLTAIQGSVEILRSRAHLNQNDERLLDILSREGDRLNKFVADFLSFARPGKHELGSIDLVPLIQDSVTLMKNSPEVRNKHTLSVQMEADEIRVLGNSDQLKQVFWNLSQNAFRAMPDGGALAIIARQTLDHGAEIVFCDSGVGMTDQEQAQLIQPFHSGFGTGTGLGLSIIYQIMEDHRGKIFFESEKGLGTAVTLRFPPEFQPAIAQTVAAG